MGVLSGAEVGTVAIPIPVFGTFFGALVGGILGNTVGQVIAFLAAKGSSAIVDTTAVALAKAASYGARRAEIAVPQPPRAQAAAPSPPSGPPPAAPKPTS
jgi:hypothetical protein